MCSEHVIFTINIAEYTCKTNMAFSRHPFQAFALYNEPHESIRGFLSKRWSFWFALFSCIAFLVGNMVGQHGFSAFWKSVWGKEQPIEIVYEGMTVPIQQIPDPDRWSPMNNHTQNFDAVPKDMFVPLPEYRETRKCGEEAELDQRVYSTRYMGDYEGGGDYCGSHADVDILAPDGTPVVAVANGTINRVDNRSSGFGNSIVLEIPNAPHPDHPKQITTLFASYGHLGTIMVQEGEVVRKGQQIGTTGDTGFSTAPHLDFQLAKDTAPFVPFWTFTTSEAARAGYDFVEAVNNGLGKDTGIEHTVSPLVYIQSHALDAKSVEVAVEPPSRIDVATQRKQDRLSSSSPSVDVVVTATKKSVKERVIESFQSIFSARRANRLAVRNARLTSRVQPQLVAVLPPAEQTSSSSPSAASSSSDASSSAAAVVAEEAVLEQHLQTPVAEPSIFIDVAANISTAETDIPMPKGMGTVTEITMLHDGAFSGDWEQIVLFARDKDGRFVREVDFEGELWMKTAFGTAEFSPATLTKEQFDDRGKAIVRMLPQKNGKKSIVPTIAGSFSVRGEPLVFHPP